MANRIAITNYRAPFVLGVLNGNLWMLSVAFTEPTTVLPVFIRQLTSSSLMVGVFTAIALSGWFLPQIFAANYLETKTKKMPFYNVGVVVRLSSWGLIILFVYLFARTRPGMALYSFLILYGCFVFAGGASGLSFVDVVAKTIPYQRLGSFFGARQFGGGILAVLAGIIVRDILQRTSPEYFPTGYLTLFALSGASLLIGLLCFSLIREPAGQASETRTPLIRFLRQAPDLFRRDGDFRRMVAAVTLNAAATIALPFYILYCRDNLALPTGAIGTYLSVQMLGLVIPNLLWAYLGDRHGSRILLQVAMVTTFLVPALALGIWASGMEPALARNWFALVFFLIGASGSGMNVARMSYLLGIAPEMERTLYAGLTNTLLGVVSLLPIAGGVLVSLASYQAVFGVAAGFSLVALVAACRLREPEAPEVRDRMILPPDRV